MKTLLLVVSLAIAFSGLTRAGDQAAEEAWISLFDGKTLEGWVRKSGFATFAVEDRAIVGTTAEGSGNTFLCTEQEFGNFELQFEVKVDAGIHSGVQIRSKLKSTGDQGREAGFGGILYGPQVAIESSPGRSGWIFGEGTGLGWLSPEPVSKDSSANQHSHLKNGEWNQFRVVAEGARIQTFVNGTRVADLTHPEIFQNHTTGFIGLQVQAIMNGTGPFQVRWRKLKIRELP